MDKGTRFAIILTAAIVLAVYLSYDWRLETVVLFGGSISIGKRLLARGAFYVLGDVFAYFFGNLEFLAWGIILTIAMSPLSGNTMAFYLLSLLIGLVIDILIQKWASDKRWLDLLIRSCFSDTLALGIETALYCWLCLDTSKIDTLIFSLKAGIVGFLFGVIGFILTFVAMKATKSSNITQ